MRRKVLNQEQAYYRIREHFEKKVEEQKIKEGQIAFRRSILQHLAEELRGEPTDLSMLDEGLMGTLFDKAKSFLGGSTKQQAALTAAVEKATSAETKAFFQQLQKIAPGFPNTKGTEKFLAGLSLLQGTYQMMAKAAQEAESQVQRITAAAAASDIAAYAQDAGGDVGRTFSYFTEGEELEEADLKALVDEKNIRRLVNIAKMTQDDEGYDQDTSTRAIAKLLKKGLRIITQGQTGGTGQMARRSGAIDTMMEVPGMRTGLTALLVDDDVDSATNTVLNSDAEDDAAAEETEPLPTDPEGGTTAPLDPGPEPNGQGGVPGPDDHDYDPDADPIEFGDPDDSDVPGALLPSQGAPFEDDPEYGGEIDPDTLRGGELPDAAYGAGEAAAGAGGAGGMFSVLGIPIAKNLAIGLGVGAGALAVGALAYGAYRYFKSKRAKGDSREGMLKSLASNLKPIKAAPGAPEEAPPGGGDIVGDPDAAGGAEATGAEPTGAAAGAGRGDINVFRGGAGKGMQSQLAKAGIQGKDMSRLLKGLRADLSVAGFNVMERKQRDEIPLDQTIAALGQIQDPAQKEAARSAVVNLLRQHGVKTSSPELKAPAAAPGKEDPRHAKYAKMAQGLQTDPGQSDLPDVPGGGADIGGEKPMGPTDAGGGLWDRDTEEDEEEKKKKGSRLIPRGPKGMKDVGTGVSMGEQQLRETLNRWQKIAGIIKG